MKILLVGEYSNMHNSLKKGLEKLGHEVIIISDNDFKNYPLDISLFAKYSNNIFLLNAARQVIYRITKFDFATLETAFRFYINRKKVIGFDYVQLVNEYALQTPLFLEKKFLKYIFKNNKKTFLSSSGDDYVCVQYMLHGDFKYSVLTPCLENKKAKHCKYTLKFNTKPFKKLHEFVYKNIAAVIPADFDYFIPLIGHPKSVPLIPQPIVVDNFTYSEYNGKDKIVIFHGINMSHPEKKGNHYFEKALNIIEKKYSEKVEIITVRSIPYNEYIKLYSKAHILLDQVYSYDQGYNALEAMAQGKVVFSGAETEFLEYFNLKEDEVLINALPDVNYLVEKLSWLIENPAKISEIGRNARQFIEHEHHYVKIAEKYLDVWQKAQ